MDNDCDDYTYPQCPFCGHWIIGTDEDPHDYDEHGIVCRSPYHANDPEYA